MEGDVSSDHRERLDLLIQQSGKSYSFYSRLLGRNAAYIQQYLRRGSPDVLQQDDAIKLAHVLGVQLSAIHPVDRPPPDPKAIFPVPILRAEGAHADQETYWFCGADWLATLTTQQHSVFAFEVQGDVMAPWAKTDDLVLCERQPKTSALRDGVYLLKLGDNLELRRVALEPRRKLVSVCADNIRYPTFGGISRTSLSVLGRVIATIRKNPS